MFRRKFVKPYRPKKFNLNYDIASFTEMRAKCVALTLDSKLNVQDGVYAYRFITGCCKNGMSEFVEKYMEDREYSISEVIHLTKGQIGHKYFKDYFEPNSLKNIHEPEIII